MMGANSEHVGWDSSRIRITLGDCIALLTLSPINRLNVILEDHSGYLPVRPVWQD